MDAGEILDKVVFFVRSEWKVAAIGFAIGVIAGVVIF